MELNTIPRALRVDEAAFQFVSYINENSDELGLEESQLYFDFPILKDLDEDVVISRLLILSRKHGILAISTSLAATSDAYRSDAIRLDEALDNLFSLLFSRLIRNRALRISKTELAFPTQVAIYSPFAQRIDVETDATQIFNNRQLALWLKEVEVAPIDENTYKELVATIEGAKGLIKPKRREVNENNKRSKGYLANLVESEIASFDLHQKHGYLLDIDGIQRIRGLAGSGKTVVLAMKAALLHLRHPKATILYTFYTKSLYQQIRRLITRFYRQFDDRDPDWSYLKVMHAWGGFSDEGVLFSACIQSGVQPLTYTYASQKNRSNPFEYYCNYLTGSANVTPAYDYIFIDEGQDFPPAFIKLALQLVRDNRLVFASDELQNIFQPTSPTMADIVGAEANGEPKIPSEDFVLYKCYRNPREIIVTAHALGFGLYSRKIVQMLENKEQWEDVGYKVLEGEFTAGSQTVIERPIENSLTSISNNQRPDQLVSAVVCENFDEEVASVVRGIQSNLADGLNPDDILVVVVDDRNATPYLNTIMEQLAEENIFCNNMNADKYGIRDFQKDGLVTLSTVHKAKGNEAYMVYVVGVDSLFASAAQVRARNTLFTAMTRAKGWVQISGIGPLAAAFAEELRVALSFFPNLVFNYPSPALLKVIKRDLKERDSKRIKAERQLEDVLGQMTLEEIQKYAQSRNIKKGSSLK